MREFFIKDNGPCCVEKAFKMIGARWTPRILELCYLHSGMDLREFRQELPTCPETTLSRRLESLQEDGLLQYNTETRAYALTMQATDILPIMLHMQHLTLLCKHTSSGYGHAVEFVYKLIGEKWKAKILWIIHAKETVRFNELLQSIEGLSHKVLSERLEDLEKSGLVNRIDYQEKSPRVEYTLTQTGKFAYQIICEISIWGYKYELANSRFVISQ